MCFSTKKNIYIYIFLTIFFTNFQMLFWLQSVDGGAYDFPAIAEYWSCLCFVWATSNVIWNISTLPSTHCRCCCQNWELGEFVIQFCICPTCLVTLPHYYLKKPFWGVLSTPSPVSLPVDYRQLTVAPTDHSHAQ